MKKIITNFDTFLIRENRKPIQWEDLPDKLYHVTTNYKKVISDGVLRMMSGLDSGGLGGTESVGVSFVPDPKTAEAICDELELLNMVNNSEGRDPEFVIGQIRDVERREFVKEQYVGTISVHKDPVTTILMALRLTRNMSRFKDRGFYRVLIFMEKNIKNKDIGIITVNKDSISKNNDIIEGVDVELGEIRILGNIHLNSYT